MIAQKRIAISRNTSGIYLRWYWNGWHHWLFTAKHEIVMSTESMDTQVKNVFSVISKIEIPTKLKSKYSYLIQVEGIAPEMVDGFNSLLMAEKVEQYEGGLWREVDITRNEHVIKEENSPAYQFSFEVMRKELPNTPAVYQKSQYLYIGDTLADIDDDEVIPINKQVNDIAEMQDRQSDFTAGFKIRKSRSMRELFELSGEVGANTTFPYEKQSIKLIQEGIEIIPVGYMILDKVDDQYYYVSVYSGNLNFFKELEGKKLSDLTLASTNHTWNATTQAASNAGDLNYIYPLCEPTDDGGLAPVTDTGSRVNMYGGMIWPFIKLKAIWDEIISNAGFTATGDILTNTVFLKMFMPISELKPGNIQKYLYLYSLTNNSPANYNGVLNVLPGGTLIFGDATFAGGIYSTPYTGSYKFKITVIISWWLSPPSVYVRDGATDTELTLNDALTYTIAFKTCYTYEGQYTASAGANLSIVVTRCQLLFYSVSIIDFDVTGIGYNSPVVCKNHLPDMSQTDFIKMVCNCFGLIPDVNSRDKKVNFWNYLELYNNIFHARDWSNYLSEREDESEFKFGDYSQNNYLNYKESDDVKENQGRGCMMINDATLPKEKDVISLPVSTADEVTILTDVDVSRIAFNKWDKDTQTYKQESSIDPRIVYVSQCANTKVFGIEDNASPANVYDTVSPKKASSLQIAFSSMVTNYSGLSRMLTKTNLRRVKFNLPVYEVAGLRYNVPIYLSQYKAYFYVNKINNYVPGKLCTIDLIKL